MVNSQRPRTRNYLFVLLHTPELESWSQLRHMFPAGFLSSFPLAPMNTGTVACRAHRLAMTMGRVRAGWASGVLSLVTCQIRFVRPPRTSRAQLLVSPDSWFGSRKAEGSLLKMEASGFAAFISAKSFYQKQPAPRRLLPGGRRGGLVNARASSPRKTPAADTDTARDSLGTIISLWGLPLPSCQGPCTTRGCCDTWTPHLPSGPP